MRGNTRTKGSRYRASYREGDLAEKVSCKATQAEYTKKNATQGHNVLRKGCVRQPVQINVHAF